MATLHLRGLALALLVVLTACGDDDGTGTETRHGGAADGGLTDGGSVDGAAGDGGSETPTRFVVCGTVPTPEGITSYAAVLDSLGASEEIVLADTLPIPAGAACLVSGDELFVASTESPVLTRFSVDTAGAFEESGRVNFMGADVATLSNGPGLFQVVDANKGYYVDPDTLRIIVWDPTTLTLGETVSLAGLAAGEGATVGIAPVVRSGERILVFASDNVGGVNAQVARVAIVDTVTDEVVFDTTDTGGGFGRVSGFAQGDGTVYVASGTFTAISERLGLPGAFPACLVRVLAGAPGFDDEFLVELADLTGGQLSAEVQGGAGAGAFLIAYDEMLRPIEEGDGLREIQGSPVWRVYALDNVATDREAELVAGLEPTAGVAAFQAVADRNYYVQLAADFSQTTLVDVTDPAAPVPGLSAPGSLLFVGVIE